jgi:hypothetical protein
MAFNTLFVIAAAFIGVVFLIMLSMGGFVFFNFFRIFNRSIKNAESQIENSQRPRGDGNRRALDALAQLPPGSPAHRCRSCGATLDSTAELSADGRIRCNYCNAWSSIYQ